jgi:hypothetical protein
VILFSYGDTSVDLLNILMRFFRAGQVVVPPEAPQDAEDRSSMADVVRLLQEDEPEDVA